MLYASLAPLTATREAQPLGRSMEPISVCACEVCAEPVFDAVGEADPAPRYKMFLRAQEMRRIVR